MVRGCGTKHTHAQPHAVTCQVTRSDAQTLTHSSTDHGTNSPIQDSYCVRFTLYSRLYGTVTACPGRSAIDENVIGRPDTGGDRKPT